MPFRELRKNDLRYPTEFPQVAKIADALRACLESEATRKAIGEVHRLGSTSHAVQACLTADLGRLGFQSEKKGLFKNYAVAALRPDFYRPIGKTGIIAEVERGKTINNNMDLLDIWKCHLCESAEFLFLIVPMERFSERGRSIKAFDQAARRLAPFFQPQNYINVDAVFLFGY